MVNWARIFRGGNTPPRPHPTVRPRPVSPDDRPPPFRVVPEAATTEAADSPPTADNSVPPRPLRLVSEPPATERPRGPAPSRTRVHREPPQLVVRLVTPQRALAFWTVLRALLARAGIQGRPTCHQDPDGTLWIMGPAPGTTVSGVAHLLLGGAWVTADGVVRPVLADGVPPPRGQAPDPRLLAEFRPVPLHELVTRTALVPTQERTHVAVVVLTAGPLARSVARRALSVGADVRYRPVRRRLLLPAETVIGTHGSSGPDEPHGAGTAAVEADPGVLLTITGVDAALPRSLLTSVAALPYTVVARALEPSQRVLVDVAHTLPVDAEELALEVPPGHQWILGTGGLAYTVDVAGNDFDARPALAATTLIRVPPPPPGLRRPGRAIDQELRLVPAAPTGAADAVLLEDGELDGLRRFLTGRPLAEDGLLVLGPGYHVLTEPGGLLTRVPFGRPLRRIGPGALYLVDGYSLHPALPTGARRSLFDLAPDRLVVLAQGQTIVFRLEEHLVALWTLWLPEQPPATVATELSSRGRAILDRLDTMVTVSPAARPRGNVQDQSRLRREALLAETNDEIERAAELLEQAGDYARAGWLLQRVARGGGRG